MHPHIILLAALTNSKYITHYMQIYIAKSGHQTGPFAEEQVNSMLTAGMVELADLAWHEGLPDWIPLHQVLNISPAARHVMQRPPLPKIATVQDASAPPPRKSKLGRILLISFCTVMGATILGAMAGDGVSTELILVKTFQYAIAGVIIYAIVKAFQALKP